jgi:hypothetical protein
VTVKSKSVCTNPETDIGTFGCHCEFQVVFTNRPDVEARIVTQLELPETDVYVKVYECIVPTRVPSRNVPPQLWWLLGFFGHSSATSVLFDFVSEKVREPLFQLIQ